MQSKVAFKKNIIKSVVNSKDLSALRCLQYLSIVIVFEIISFAFVKEYDGLVVRTKEITDDLPAMNVPLSGDLQTLRTRIFFEWFSIVEHMDFRERSFQLKHGYTYFVKFIVRFCGQLEPAAEESMTGNSSNKRRKLQGAKGGDSQEVNAVNNLVRLLGEGIMRCSCANLFIYSLLGFESTRRTETRNSYGKEFMLCARMVPKNGKY